MYKYKATKMIADALDNCAIEYEVENQADIERIFTGFRTNDIRVLMAYLVCGDNKVTVQGIVPAWHTPENKRSAMLEMLNKCNLMFDFAKIFLDPDGDVALWYDFTTECADFGKAATEVFFGLSKDIRSVSLSIKEVLNPEEAEKERAKIAEELYTFLDQILGRGFLDAVPHEEQPE